MLSLKVSSFHVAIRTDIHVMKIGSANHFTAIMHPRLAALITCSMSVLLVLDGGKRKCIQNL